MPREANVLLGVVHGVAQIVRHRESELPFGPSLCAGTVAIVVGRGNLALCLRRYWRWSLCKLLCRNLRILDQLFLQRLGKLHWCRRQEPIHLFDLTSIDRSLDVGWDLYAILGHVARGVDLSAHARHNLPV